MNALTPLRAELGAGSEPAAPRPHRFTLQRLVAMRSAGLLPRRPRVELLDGEIIEMPEEGELHAWFKIELIYLLTRRLGEDLRLAADTTLSLAPEEAPEPDLWVFTAGAALRSTPGSALRLIIEVADSSLCHDLNRKAAKYASYGVAEYWVIDVRGKRTFVHLQPEGDAYLERTVVAFDQPLVPTRIQAVRLVIADLPRFDGLSFD